MKVAPDDYLGVVAYVRESLEDVAIHLLGDYQQWVEAYDPLMEHSDKIMRPEAYIRGRIMNELDDAIKRAMLYAETNGGI